MAPAKVHTGNRWLDFNYVTCSMTLNAVELGQTVTRSGVRMSTSTAHEALQTTQVLRGEVHPFVMSQNVTNSTQVWRSIFMLPRGHWWDQFKPGQPYVWFWSAVSARGIQVCYRIRFYHWQQIAGYCKRKLRQRQCWRSTLKAAFPGFKPSLRTTFTLWLELL